MPRRRFLGLSAATAAGLPWRDALGLGAAANAKVAIVPCTSYSVAMVKAAYKKSFDLLGGIQKLVRGKTVAIKLNLTGTNFMPCLGHSVGETYMTHYSTVLTLVDLLFSNGAQRVRLVESTNSRATLEQTLDLADWDVKALRALGPVEFENTRNLGLGKQYATVKVPGPGYLFSSFDLNHAYVDTDVFVSLAKLKNHVTAGVTLSMKNLFGITPTSLYGDEAGSEDAVAGRGRLHGPGCLQTPGDQEKISLPGMKMKYLEPANDHGIRVPRTVADLCAARPIDLAIIDGITSVSGGEGPWAGEVRFTQPGLLFAGLNPVSTDAVATAVMGYENPRAPRGTPPFDHCENHLLLAEQAGVGTADLSRIEVLGQPLAKSIFPYHSKRY
jgi:uncharacterized protein (DUF362 family)